MRTAALQDRGLARTACPLCSRERVDQQQVANLGVVSVYYAPVQTDSLGCCSTDVQY